MSGTGTILYSRFYNRRSRKYFNEKLIPSSLNFQTDIRNFTGTFDGSIEVNKISDIKAISSHDFVELFFVLPNGIEHQVGVCFIEDIVDQTSPDSIRKDFNGKELIGQLFNPPFAQARHFKTTNMVQFAREAVKGEYLNVYCRSKGRGPIVSLNSYSGNIRVSSDLTQTKGALLQNYAEMAINIIYQNRLGQLVIYGGTGRGRPRGSLVKGKNIDSLRVAGTYSGVISEIITFFSSGQAVLDKNKVNSPTFINDDPRVRGIVYRPQFKTFSSSDLQIFDVTPNERINQIAKSAIRKSNANLASVVIDVKEPFYNDGLNIIPYEIGQSWTIETPEEELRTKDFPDGTTKADMILAGIHYSQDSDGLSVQLLFIEQGTLQ